LLIAGDMNLAESDWSLVDK